MSGTPTNGQDAEVIALDTLVLTYDRVHDKLEIGGKCNSMDLMLDMLARAVRTLETQYRAQRAVELGRQMAQAAQDQAIADQVRRSTRQ
jgi:predicted DNA-binding protein (UPF0278 family)